MFVDTYFVRFFESDASDNPAACLYIYIYTYGTCKCIYIYMCISVYMVQCRITKRIRSVNDDKLYIAHAM